MGTIGMDNEGYEDNLSQYASIVLYFIFCNERPGIKTQALYL